MQREHSARSALLAHEFTTGRIEDPHAGQIVAGGPHPLADAEVRRARPARWTTGSAPAQ